MGERQPLPGPDFNRSIKIEFREERITSDAGALALREVADKLGVFDWLCEHIEDTRAPDRVVHPLAELLATSVLLMALGWRDQDDADALRHDCALRLAVSTRRGTAPLSDHDDPNCPDGLASQPTMSRLMAMLSSDHNRAVLRRALLVTAARRIRSANAGKRLKHVTVDVDSVPFEVSGHQQGSAYNGHYRCRIYHPLVATIADSGDLLDVQLRQGNVHTADGSTEFILAVLDAVQTDIAEQVSVRFDAGFPSEPLLAALEDSTPAVPYVARLRTNRRLDELARRHLDGIELHCSDHSQPAVHLFEETYQARSWSRPRRVVLVVQPLPGELFPRVFWLLTNWPADQLDANALLELYRRRGQAESHFGEWKSTVAPALSSTRRSKSHHRGRPPKQRTPSRDPFAVNEVILLLSAIAYNLLNALRHHIEQASGKGCSLQRLRQRLLKVPARALLHAHYVVFVLAAWASVPWQQLWHQLSQMPPCG